MYVVRMPESSLAWPQEFAVYIYSTCLVHRHPLALPGVRDGNKQQQESLHLCVCVCVCVYVCVCV